MIASTFRRQDSGSTPTTPSGLSRGNPRPAAVAAARVSLASLLLGAFGLASAIFVIGRLLESWQVTTREASHQISIFGQQLSYPTANIDAIVILILAVLGAAVTVLAIGGVVRELTASRRFLRNLTHQNPEPLRDALVITDPEPRAFCAGLLRPRVYLSTGTLSVLDEAGLEAVLAHERHHARCRDPLRLAVARVLARALFFLPPLRALAEQHRSLAELGADESAVNAAPANRSGLASAMLSFSDAPSSVGSKGIDPARVDFLLGEPPSWRFPALLCVAAGSVLALLVAVGALAGHLASGSATLAPPFLSRQPCVVVLAAIPAVLGVLTAAYRRRVRTRTAAATQ